MFRNDEVINGVYRIVQVIGQGGTGVVYLAYHMHLQKYVVLKKLKIHSMNVMNLRAETDILKDLHHTYLPQVYDFVVKENDVFTVMDYIPGSDLGAYQCGAANIPEEYILKWLRQMAEVISYLEDHDPPVIHSDIKPANIIVRPDGTICLIDFNISIEENAAGKVIGYSVSYASPEQTAMAQAMEKGMRAGYALDSRTDIYSIGATFYHLMSGQMPDSRYLVPKLADMGDIGYSPALCAIIDKCMEWDRENRYPNAKALLHAIDHFRKQDPAYRRYVFMKAASWITSALLIAGGIWCIFRGIQVRAGEEYQMDYSSMTAYVRENNLDAAAGKAYEILNNESYRSILASTPEDAAQTYHILGDVYFGRGDYNTSSQYYKDALDQILVSGLSADDYYRDYAISLAYEGQTGQAAGVIAESGLQNSVSNSLRLVNAVIDFKEEDYVSCIADVSSIIEECGDNSLCARACRVASQACGAEGKMIEQKNWLEKALAYEESRQVREEYASVCMQISQSYSGRNDQKIYAEEALKSYEKLISLPNPSMNDRINCAITCYYLAQYDKAIEILQGCYQEIPADYKVSMYLALCYAKTNQIDESEAYCRKALDLYERTGPNERSGGDAEAIEMLKELKWQMTSSSWY